MIVNDISDIDTTKGHTGGWAKMVHGPPKIEMHGK